MGVGDEAVDHEMSLNDVLVPLLHDTGSHSHRFETTVTGAWNFTTTVCHN